VPAPRVKVTQADGGQVIEPILDGTATLENFHAAFLAAFGTIDEVVAEALFTQLLNTLHTEPGKPVDCATANLALALMHEIGPKDVIEAMLAVQMVATHFGGTDAVRRAIHFEQSAGGRAVYLSLARKLMTLFTAQMDTLNRHRGKPSVQKVVVERVNIEPGGNAFVGAVAGAAVARQFCVRASVNLRERFLAPDGPKRCQRSAAPLRPRRNWWLTGPAPMRLLEQFRNMKGGGECCRSTRRGSRAGRLRQS
jgi:hypothetical protein